MYQDIFVGRRNLLENSTNFLLAIRTADVDESARLLTVQGPGGIGKTKLLTKIRERVNRDLGFIATEVLDLRATSNRSSISLLQTIARSLDHALESDERVFGSFYAALVKYNEAKAREKFALYEPLIQSFIDCCIAASAVTPLVIFLDTFESVQDVQLGEWLLNLVPRLRGSIGVVIAGRRDATVPGTVALPLQVGKLSADEIDELGKKLFESRGIGADYDLTLETIKTLEYLTDGRPILVVLAIEWILEKVELDRIVSIDKEGFESEIVSFLWDLRDRDNFEERQTIIMMAAIDKRFSALFLSHLTKWPPDKCQDICRELSRFSFLKVIPAEEARNQIFTLHDEMLRLVNQHVNYPLKVKNKWREEIVRSFYEEEVLSTSNPQARQTLIAEMLHYQLRYDPETAILNFDQQMSVAVEGYEFEFCELLLSEARNPELELDDRQSSIVDLKHAEMLVKRYQPFEAKPIFDKLILCFDGERDTEYLSCALGGLGACIASGCTVIEANLAEAIDLWKRSLAVCREQKLEDRVASILYQLGYCYDLLGLHGEALRYYGESNELARKLGNLKLVTTTLDEMGRLRRKRYEVPESLELFLESLEIKEEIGDIKSMGVSYHYIGDAYRDLDNFPEALKWYSLAEEARKRVADDYGLCVLYGDIGWLYLLDENWEKAIECTDKSYYDRAIPFHFGREMAEMEHSYYHIELETRGLDAALPWIERAFENAEKYSNAFIYLDAAMHLIEAAYQKKEWDKIPFYYEKMAEMEKKGCGYLMFQGRATNIMGDLAYDQGDLSSALDYWREGYTIVAIHGRSRSTVLNFEERFRQRHSRLTEAFLSCGLQRLESFQSHWQNTILDKGKPETLFDEYPAMVGLCRCAAGDIYYTQGDHERAITCWFQGMVDIAMHIVLRDRAQVLSLDDYLNPRKANIRQAISAVHSATVQNKLQGLRDRARTILENRPELEHFERILSDVQLHFQSDTSAAEA